VAVVVMTVAVPMVVIFATIFAPVGTIPRLVFR
jgi:hypothetical protein